MDSTEKASYTENSLPGTPQKPVPSDSEAFAWLEQVLPIIMRRLLDAENLDMPLLQLPLAQLRLTQALYHEDMEVLMAGQTMGKLSEKLGVRQNALTQAADRLVNHALAERLNDPTDRRIVRLRLTEKGRIWVSERRARRRARLVELWNKLELQERLTLLEAVRTIESFANRMETQEHLQNETAKTPAPRRTLPTVEEVLSQLAEQA